MSAVPAPRVTYSVRAAARRVRRERRTIQNWLSQGMPCRRLGTHRVEIDEDVLLEWYRRKLVGAKASRFKPRTEPRVSYDR